MRKLRKEIKWLMSGIIISQAITISLNTYNNSLERELNYLEAKVTNYNVVIQTPRKTLKNKEEKDIIVTNYYLGDGTSGTTTASGYKISDFDVNEEGMYTLNGMIVLATANVDRLDWSLKDGFNTHNLFDILEITFNKKNYTGIVLDVCGACYGINGEELQRYDVFTTGEVIGKIEGTLK